MDWITALRAARMRLRSRLLAVLQTAAAAVIAWYLALLLLDDPRPSFASIAAVIAVGATHGARIVRAVQLVAGVVLGLTVAALIVQVIGTGGWQLGVLVVLAMSAAILLRGGELLVVEAGVSAILLVAIDPGAAEGFSPTRILEGLIGGATALVVSSVLFPRDPALAAGRAVQAVFDVMGRALLRIADALERGEDRMAEDALNGARGIDDLLRGMEEELAAGRDTARWAPPRRRSRGQFERYKRSAPQIDFAVRNIRVLARHVLRLVREGAEAPGALPQGIRQLAEAVWELAATYDSPQRAPDARRSALRAVTLADEAGTGDPTVILVAGQIRAVAIDVIRAAEQAAADAVPPHERPTEELLANAP